MNKKQIFDLIESNSCVMAKLEDYAGNRLQECGPCATPQALVKELEEIIENFKGYKKLKIFAKKGTAETPWSKGFIWAFEFDGETPTGTGFPAATPVNGVDVVTYIGTVTRHLEEMAKVQKELFELKMEKDKNDPTKWIPIIEMFGPSLGLKTNPARAIAGPPKQELHFEDIKTDLNEEQITDEIGKQLQDIGKKVKGSQMLVLLTMLNRNPDLKLNMDKINALLQAINKKPELLEMAMKFI